MREHYLRAKELESILKGVSHHRRVEMLFVLLDKPNLTLNDLSEKTDTDPRNTSQHVFKMVHAGLIKKRTFGYTVEHSLTKLGEEVAKHIKRLRR